ncbi:saccharopine dehydrogenase [Phyllobacterium zundukense]|uniref:Saccharopine dehydrogenase n=1 Tax=Phyllobacterium zundukense TaxID=1867719 RepID=A0A2N9VZB7_9HYPH|nr:saccharopine dehydrogenase [Phyllobacterium zundukense]ATU90911.1 saccharopine dehydrogenase [Phyllobacterium zundukense]PIO44835.1 saccharopine dehydrogenase [Phyllobacterium zundukense]
MSLPITKPVLIIGGSGIVGAKTAQTLRRLHPDLPIAIGGRDIAKAQGIAEAVGNAVAARIDLDRTDLGQDASSAYSAIAVFVKDETLNSMKYAQAHGLPYLSVSSGVFEVGPEMALAIRKPGSAPILMASNWLAGAATFPALQAALDFRTIDQISITVVLDEQDMGGPAAFADFQRLTESAPNPLQLKDGRWRWVKGEEAKRGFIDIDGTEVEASAYSPLDVLSLSTATDVKSIRFDLVYGMSASRRRGDAFSTEIAIEISGELLTGEKVHKRLDIVHPEGQAPLTALHVALGIERLLGLSGGEPVEPGIYLPDMLMEPEYVVRQMKEFGTVFRQN